MKFNLKKKDTGEKTSITNWYGSFRKEHILDNWWAKAGLGLFALIIVIVISFVAMSFLKSVEDIKPGIRTELEDRSPSPREAIPITEEEIKIIEERRVPDSEIRPVQPEEIKIIEQRRVPIEERTPITDEEIEAIRNRRIE